MVPVPHAGGSVWLTLVRADFLDREPAIFLLMLSCTGAAEAERLLHYHPFAAVARLRLGDRPPECLLFDAAYDQDFSETLLRLVAGERSLRGDGLELQFQGGRRQREVRAESPANPRATFVRTEPGSTRLTYDDRFSLKLFRQLEHGINPDLELSRLLLQRGFTQTLPVVGSIRLVEEGSRQYTLGVLRALRPLPETDAWNFTLDAARGYLDQALSSGSRLAQEPVPAGSPLELDEGAIPAAFLEISAPYLESARLIGRRAGQMHLALSRDSDEPAFAPEPFSRLYQRSLYQAMRSQAARVLDSLRAELNRLPEPVRPEARALLDRRRELLGAFESFTARKLGTMRLRCHGDFHLERLLYTGKDFLIVDFEGLVDRSLSERRIKRSPFRDVATMLRSFTYAAYSVLLTADGSATETLELKERLVRLWSHYVGGVFLHSYLETAAGAPFIPADRGDLEVLLHNFMLDKAVDELGYELRHRPHWLVVPARGILELIGRLERPAEHREQ